MRKALSLIGNNVWKRIKKEPKTGFAEKALGDIPGDSSFWAEQESVFMGEAGGMPNELLLQGVEQAESLGLIVDFDKVNQQVLDFSHGYTNKWWNDLARDTQRGLRTAIATHIESGAPLSVLQENLTPLFGRRRAEMIAATETTRLFAEGNKIAYRDAGVVQVEWRSVMDGKVCTDCEDMENEGPYSINDPKVTPPLHVRCFIDGQVPIYTAKGLKPIGDIAVGDLVLTHKGRFRRVRALSRVRRQVEEVVRLYLKVGTRVHRCSTMTANHPILTPDGWVEAGQLRIGDAVQVLSLGICLHCGARVPWFRRCCVSCQYQRTADGLWSNPKSRAKAVKAIGADTRASYKDGRRDPKRQTAKARAGYVEKYGELGVNLRDPEVGAKAKRLMASNPKFVSFIERKLRWLLEEKDIAFEIGSRICVGFDSLGRSNYVFPDLLLPELRLIIEADGVQWHDVERDARRDALLGGLGYRVLRFTEEEIRNDLATVSVTLDRVMANDAHQYGSVEAQVIKADRWTLRKSRTLYNFDVEEDESYVANGLLVHNCRCWIAPVVNNKPLLEPI